MARTIAIVEDEKALLENYAVAFRRQGYGVQAYASGREAMLAFRVRLPDIVILDISLGGDAEAGFDLCQQLRAMSVSLPIVFLTARDSDLDTVSGLRLGADDYLTKNISLPHLLARVAALLRRVDALRAPCAPEDLVERGALRLDVNRMSSHWHEVPVPLTVTEFWIVHALARYPGHVKSREQLMGEAKLVVDEATITSHIKRIRRKFCRATPDFDCINTVYGMGYRWSCRD